MEANPIKTFYQSIWYDVALALCRFIDIRWGVCQMHSTYSQDIIA